MTDARKLRIYALLIVIAVAGGTAVAWLTAQPAAAPKSVASAQQARAEQQEQRAADAAQAREEAAAAELEARERVAEQRRRRREARARAQAESHTGERFKGTGTLVGVAGGSGPSGAGPVRRYSVEVESGLDVDPAEFAAQVDRILADPRGWTADGSFAFQRVAAGQAADFRVVLASPQKTDQLCAPLDTEGKVSCNNAGRAVINYWRWEKGVAWYPQIAQYRNYVINHEVGHAIGHGHRSCPSPGAPAPVMLQQTYGMQGCALNPWPLASERAETPSGGTAPASSAGSTTPRATAPSGGTKAASGTGTLSPEKSQGSGVVPPPAPGTTTGRVGGTD